MRSISDHFPIMWDSQRVQQGPNPFSSKNIQIQHRNFVAKMKEWWNDDPVSEWVGYKFMQKLKLFKER